MDEFKKIFDRLLPLSPAEKARQEAALEYEQQVRATLLSVNQLRTAGQHRAALLSCGRIMEEAVRKWNPWGGVKVPKHVQLSAEHMARILAQIYPEIANKFDRTKAPPYEYYVLVIEAEMDSEDEDSLLTVVPLAGHIFRDPQSPKPVKASCESIIRRVIAREKALDLDAQDLNLAYQLLAESYVYEGFASTGDPATVAAIIHRHLRHLSWLSGSATLENLRFPYAVARDHLINGRATEAHNLLKKILTQREKLADETHTRLNSFIDSLLESFCQALNKSTARHELWGMATDSFINDLLEFCLENEKYVEADTLVQECTYRINETRADSPNDKFWIWDQLDDGAQSKLAKHRTPQNSFYWEDSRMYCRTWDSVAMERAFPIDPMPGIPVALTVYPDRIECEDAESAARLLNSEIIRLLEAKRWKNDWRILVAYDQQNWQDTSKAFASTPGPHKFWIFPEDVVECAEYVTTQDATSAGMAEQGQCSGAVRHTAYRFQQLKSDRSEWIVVRPAQDDSRSWNEDFQDPNEPIEDGLDGYRHLYRDYENRGLEPYPRASDMTYKIEDAGQFDINVSIPYVPWQHFERSTGYRAGLTYDDYISCMADRLGSSYHWHEYRAKMCTDKAKDGFNPPHWRLSVSKQSSVPDNFQTKSQTMRITNYGFFNGIPSGNAMIVANTPVTNANLVSTRWHDWKRFTLHKSTPNLTPNLTLHSGRTVKCLGYIMGCWANEGNIGRQWMGLRLFVVDATLGDDTSDQAYNFILAEGCLGSANEYSLTGPEKRFVCGELNPYLFRYAKAQLFHWGSVWKQFQKVDSADSNDEAMNHWEEMIRREKWDRAYEKRLRRCEQQYDNGNKMEALRQELEQEEVQRLQWDAANLSPPTLSLDALTSSVGLSAPRSETAGSSGRVGATPSVSIGNSTSSIGHGTKDSGAPVQALAGSAFPSSDRPRPERSIIKKLFGRGSSS